MERLQGGGSLRNTGNDRTKHGTSHDFVVSMIYQNGEKGKKQAALAGGGLSKEHGKRQDETWDMARFRGFHDFPKQ